MPYLQRNDKGTWRVRREVPADVCHAFNGRKWFVRSLETRDPREADKRATDVIAEFDRRVERARAGELFSKNHDIEHYAREFLQGFPPEFDSGDDVPFETREELERELGSGLITRR